MKIYENFYNKNRIARCTRSYQQAAGYQQFGNSFFEKCTNRNRVILNSLALESSNLF